MLNRWSALRLGQFQRLERERSSGFFAGVSPGRRVHSYVFNLGWTDLNGDIPAGLSLLMAPGMPQTGAASRDTFRRNSNESKLFISGNLQVRGVIGPLIVRFMPGLVGVI